MQQLALLMGLLFIGACNYTPSLKLTVSNESQREVKNIRIGHNNADEAVTISALKPGEEQKVKLEFKTSKKEDGRYWITTGDGFVDSFGFYKKGLPVHMWIGIKHHGDYVEVSLQ